MVISRHRKNENVFKMSKDEKCTCKACKNTVFHCQICIFVGLLLPSSSWLLNCLSYVFCIPNMKPRFLSVVQFPSGNYHSLFSPTTFFEIGVYKYFYACFFKYPEMHTTGVKTASSQCKLRKKYCKLCHL